MDWVPCYGNVLLDGGAVAPGAWSAALLAPDLTRPFTQAVATPGEYEGEDNNYFIERIVGTVSASVPGTNVVPTIVRIQPLQADLDLSIPDVPWNVNTPDGTFMANFRFWWERRYNAVPETASFIAPELHRTNALEVDHPWWTQVDIRPKQVFGRTDNLWPCMTGFISNSSPDRVRVAWSLRMLLKEVR